MIRAWLLRRRRRVLAALEARGDRTAADLMRETGLSAATVYPVLIVAEERGLVASRWGTPARVDGPRPVRYSLTPAGRLEVRS